MNWDLLLEQAKKVLAELGDSFTEQERETVIAAIEDYADVMTSDSDEEERAHAKAQLKSIQSVSMHTAADVMHLAVTRLMALLGTLVRGLAV